MKNSRSKIGYLAFLIALLSISTVDQVMQVGDPTVTIDLAADAGNQNEITQLKKSNLQNEKAFNTHDFLCDL